MTAMEPEPPLGLILELTHRCPLQCPYCSNPLALERPGTELDTKTWERVLEEATELGVLQAHFSGGEPTARRDLTELIAHARSLGLYSNLITAGVLLDRARMAALVAAGIDHVQLSFQDVDPANADRIAGLDGGHARKLAAARLVREAGLPLTVNFVVHRQNLERLPQMLALAEKLDAARVEIAHVQYHGWALRNRAALLPTREQLERSIAEVDTARRRLAGQMVIDFVLPDYYASRPKACMGGWARRSLTISPAGLALPCHAATSLPGFAFPSVVERPLAEIWSNDPAFRRFRGTAWMPEPCASCERREIDWGGCRCQAFALIGDPARTDPACALSPHHALMVQAALESLAPPPEFIYRRLNAAVRPAAELALRSL